MIKKEPIPQMEEFVGRTFGQRTKRANDETSYSLFVCCPVSGFEGTSPPSHPGKQTPHPLAPKSKVNRHITPSQGSKKNADVNASFAIITPWSFALALRQHGWLPWARKEESDSEGVGCSNRKCCLWGC